MQTLLLYIFKLSIALSVVFLFYQLVLRRLTFYNCNRWYLTSYTLLSFLIPLINITPVLEDQQWQQVRILEWVPVVTGDTVPGTISTEVSSYEIYWSIAGVVFCVVSTTLLIKLWLQLYSFMRVKRQAELIEENGTKLYRVNKPGMMPFSFGNAIFINPDMHTAEELQEIIHHEFVHVKQKHSIDIIWAEILCVINWFNPFAWMLKHAIRQNLEFIADQQVISNGMDRRQYQYLLLKVIGSHQYSIATPFNFSSLKKRIAMMNKTKSSSRQLLRLLFILPATILLLLAFRSGRKEQLLPEDKNVRISGIVIDAETNQPLSGVKIVSSRSATGTVTDERGYYLISIPYENKPLQFSLRLTKNGYQEYVQQENWGNFYKPETAKSYSNSFEFFGMSKKEVCDPESFSALVSNVKGYSHLNYENTLLEFKNLRWQEARAEGDTTENPTPPGCSKYNIQITDVRGHCTILITDPKSNKKVARMKLTEWNRKKNYYEALYGELPPAPPPPPVPAPPPPPPPPPPPTGKTAYNFRFVDFGI